MLSGMIRLARGWECRSQISPVRYRPNISLGRKFSSAQCSVRLTKLVASKQSLEQRLGQAYKVFGDYVNEAATRAIDVCDEKERDRDNHWQNKK